MLISSNKAFADTTIFQTIGPINYNGSASTAYSRGDAAWGAPGCPNAVYVQIKNDIAGRKEILAIALAAKSTAKRVQFWGACNADVNYFDAFYIVAE